MPPGNRGLRRIGAGVAAGAAVFLVVATLGPAGSPAATPSAQSGPALASSAQGRSLPEARSSDATGAVVIADMAIAPTRTSPNVPVTVETTVSNPLDVEQEVELTLLVDEAPEETRTVTLPAGASKRLRFLVSRPRQGAHTVRLGNSAQSFLVLGADVQAVDLDVAPLLVAPGGSVEVTAVLENRGTAVGAFDFPLMVDDSPGNNAIGFLSPEETRPFGFVASAETVGFHRVNVGRLSTLFAVAGPVVDFSLPARVNINPDTTDALDAEGRPLEITGTLVSLSASGAGAATIELPVALDPGGVLSSFFDLESGVVLEAGELRVLLRGPGFEVAGILKGEVEEAAGTGLATLVTLKNVTLESPVSSVSLSRGDSPAREVSVTLELAVSGIPVGGSVQVTPSTGLAARERAALEQASRQRGLTVTDTAVVLQVQRRGFGADIRVEALRVRVGIGQEWVAEHGGDESVRVAEIAGDGGVRLLETQSVGDDGSGRRQFLAQPGEGVDAVALVAVAPALEFTVPQLRVVPAFARPGESVQVTASITPTGEAKGRVGVPLLVDGVAVDARAISLAPGATGEVGFFLRRGDVGQHRVEVGNRTATLVVAPEAPPDTVQVLDLEVTPREVVAGEPVQVIGQVRNTSDQPVIVEIPLEINETPVDVRRLFLPPSAIQGVRFVVVQRFAGEYRVALGEMEEALSVIPLILPASLEVQRVVAPVEPVFPGEPVRVQVVVANNGDEAGDITLALLVDGVETEERELTVDGLTVVPVPFELEVQQPGRHVLQADGVQGNLFVVPEVLPRELAIGPVVFEPLNPRPGEETLITVSVENRGPVPQQGAMRLEVEGVRVASEEVALEPESEEEVIFSMVRGEPGLYRLEFVLDILSPRKARGRLRAELLVFPRQRPASFQVTRLDVTPREAKPGETVTVAVLVSNVGEVDGSSTLTLRVNGQVTDVRLVEVPGRRSLPVSFRITREEAGEYAVDVNGLKGSFTVGGPLGALGAKLVLGPLQIEPARAVTGEAVTVAAEVVNEDEVPGTLTLALEIDGQEFGRREVTLGPGERRIVEFTVALDEPGSYQVMVGGAEGTLIVSAPSGGPPWGVIGGSLAAAALLGVVGAYLFLRGRRRAA